MARTETVNILNIDHQKRIEELKCQHEASLKELEDKQSALILKIQDWEATWVEEVKSWAKNELRNMVASKEPGTGIDYLQMCDNVVESMIEAGDMVTETNSPSVSKTVLLQNSLVKYDRANEMDILVSNDQPVSGSEDHNATENQYVSQEIIISKHSHSREQNSDVATSMTDEDNRCAKFGHGSQDGCEMPSLGNTCLPDCENATHLEHQCSDGVSSSIPEGKILVEVQETNNEGDSMCVSEIHVQVEMPVTDSVTDCLLQNATHLNPPSSIDQISDRGSIDAPVLDAVMIKISLSNPPLEQQIPDGDVPFIVPENSHAVGDCDKGIGPSTNATAATLVDNSTTNAIVTSVNVMEPLGHGKQLPSVESAADKDSDGEMQNSSEQIQLASSSSDIVPANQITVPSNQVNQLAHAELSSNLVMSGLSNVHLATEDEHQLNSICGLPANHSEQSSVVPNKDVGQSHLNSNLDLLTASRVRAQSANPRNFSIPLAMKSHPIQSKTPSPSRRLPHLSHDIEFKRIQKIIEKTSKNNEDMKLQLKSDFEKELAELRRKYDVKLQEIEVDYRS
ncbi:hypothetical protein MtrunA17_Chr2g0326941 [Medicago truncatula]|uniref:Uncharacterized protein n=1 Tax=Medicago truncatula TaxID=3880 RepID=A0A396JCS9_MEDTR|nr:hypothetical protein MtrunA17_Chr2g0326941 [Medicago truncatula]